ncbi:MAG: hypothetical protein AAGC76_13415 [Luteibacter sp.]|uniref:hypothetical protein n=1 Tax=Luteibacter sp. TaxID=1886636 RepID=UPI00055E04B5|nr:hypothetical protein [Luteibacter sp.]MDQ7996831.1 hypothetical protein [Luteibacter sp.]MDQ8049202.1 hypothetical protein [Luteibacter sp.]
MKRPLLIALVLLSAFSLSGCIIRDHRHGGYGDRGGPGYHDDRDRHCDDRDHRCDDDRDHH